MATTEHAAWVSIGNTQLTYSVMVKHTDIVSDVADRLRIANGIGNAQIMLQSNGIALDISKTLADSPLVSLQTTADSKQVYRLDGIVIPDTTMTTTNSVQKLASTELKTHNISEQLAILEKRLQELTALVQEQALEIRRRPRSYSQLQYPGSRVWTRPLSIVDADGVSLTPKLASIESLIARHDKWMKEKDLDTVVYCVAINGPVRTFEIEFEPHAKSSEPASKITVWCVRVLLPVPKVQGTPHGAMKEYDAIGGWTSTIFDSFLEKPVTREITLLGEASPVPVDDEYYLSPVSCHNFVPTTAAFE